MQRTHFPPATPVASWCTRKISSLENSCSPSRAPPLELVLTSSLLPPQFVEEMVDAGGERKDQTKLGIGEAGREKGRARELFSGGPFIW